MQERRSQRRPGGSGFVSFTSRWLLSRVAIRDTSTAQSHRVHSGSSAQCLRCEDSPNPQNHLEDKVKVLSPALFTTLMPAAKAPNHRLHIGLGYVGGILVPGSGLQLCESEKGSPATKIKQIAAVHRDLEMNSPSL